MIKPIILSSTPKRRPTQIELGDALENYLFFQQLVISKFRIPSSGLPRIKIFEDEIWCHGREYVAYVDSNYLYVSTQKYKIREEMTQTPTGARRENGMTVEGYSLFEVNYQGLTTSFIFKVENRLTLRVFKDRYVPCDVNLR